MKQLIKAFLILCILLLSFPVFAYTIPNSSTHDFRGVWVASVVNIDYPSTPTTDSETLKIETIKILDHAKDTGLNAVFLQVRPTADALYQSKYFPWSKYLTGKQGDMPKEGFDPLEFWITEAHRRKIELHAWINPYRITKRTSGEPIHDLASLAPSNPARLNPGWVVKHSDGNLYFNPGIPEVRKLIVNGILEIINNYQVDGIHFDDYFYPDKNFNDIATFNKYKSGNKSLDDWRRENVNSLLRDVSKAIKSTRKNIRFGVSPFGIWANKTSNTQGSDTKGLESYYSHYADSLYWVKQGLVDYIVPQIYWNIGYSIADYSKLLVWWENAVSGTNVDLYIGHAAYKAGNTNPSSPWYGSKEIEQQLQLNAIRPKINGSIFFSFKSLSDNPALTASIKAIYERQDGKNATIPVSISRPSGDIKTRYTDFYLNGESDPNKPLYLNGHLVENRSSQGYFGVLVPLSPGANSFTFSQEASYAMRSIYRDIGSAAPSQMSKAEIPLSSAFPQSQESRMPGEKITLSCQAPIGSNVTVKLGGNHFTMKPSATVSKGSGLYATTFTYVYTIPSYSGTPRFIDLGAPVYTMKYNGTTKFQTSPARIGVIMEGTPYYAEVAKDVIDTYNAPVTGNGAAYELYRGMVDSVTGMTGSYARLSSGQWVFKSNIKIFSLNYTRQSAIKKAQYMTGEKWDTLKLDIPLPAAAIASFDGTSLKLSVSSALSATKPALPSSSPFSSLSVSTSNKITEYTLTIKQGQQIEGYYVEKTFSGLNLRIKRKIVLNRANLSLSGLTIMLDPGHGGSESGAIGPLGLRFAEKDINLKLSMKLKAQLESLGATVLMTRTTDTTVSLGARLSASRNAKPDMFMSVHANSMADNADISKIHGFSIFYREALAKPLSDTIYNHTINTLGRNKHGVNKRNFYVTRGTWTPSILIESGFVPNPLEFEWLTSENEQNRLVKTMSDAIVRYFSN